MFRSVNWGKIALCFGLPTASVSISSAITTHWAVGLLPVIVGASLAAVFVGAELRRFRKLSPSQASSFRYEDFRRSGFFFLEL